MLPLEENPTYSSQCKGFEKVQRLADERFFVTSCHGAGGFDAVIIKPPNSAALQSWYCVTVLNKLYMLKIYRDCCGMNKYALHAEYVVSIS
jgi:hypothetical protein